MSYPIRVLVTSPPFELEGGVANYVRLLLKHMAPEKASFEHVSVGKQSDSSSIWRRPFEYFSSLWRFVRTFLRANPDVVHINPSLNWGSLPLSLVLVVLSKALSDRPVVLFFHGWDDAIAEAMTRRSLIGRLLSSVLAHADHYLVLANRFRDQLIAAGFPAQRITVTSTMVEADKLRASTTPGSSQPKTERPFHILFLSRLVRAKGVWELMDAME